MINSIEIDKFSDLSSQLSDNAKAGESFFLTKNGTALYYAIPIDKALMDQGSLVATALNLYKNNILSLGQAAKFISVSIEEFISLGGKAGISVIDYDDDIPDSELPN